MLEIVDAKLTLVGSFSDLKTELTARSHPAWNKVDYLGVLPYEDIKTIYNGDYIGLIPFQNLGQYRHSHVIKVFEYMAYGLPIIMPNFGDWLSFNNKYLVGENTNTENPDDFSRTVSEMLKRDVLKYSISGRKHVKDEFLWSSVEKKLFERYKELLRG